jgi:hypothetical protein
MRAVLSTPLAFNCLVRPPASSRGTLYQAWLISFFLSAVVTRWLALPPFRSSIVAAPYLIVVFGMFLSNNAVMHNTRP